MRKEKLISQLKKGNLFIIIAKIKNKKVKYCIASVKENMGEIDLIYVKTKHRKKQIGNDMIEKSLNWLKSKNVEKIIVNIFFGNEEVFDFYINWI